MTAPLITRWGSSDPEAPLIVLCAGAGETELVSFARYLPDGAGYASVRLPPAAPLDVGRDVVWFHGWLDQQRGQVPIVLVGFASGVAFAGGLLLAEPRLRGRRLSPIIHQ